ncbi:MAG: hypothetical protein ACO3ZW_01910 [Opitutales bacterium]|jgi:hypothetical protein
MKCLPSLATISLLLSTASAVSAQARQQVVDFDSPEGWAMKYFSSVGMMQGNGPPPGLEKGQWVIGLEISNIPHLSKEERTVGFDGTKEEDLNKSPLLARPLLHYGITRRLSATMSYLPPVEVFTGLKTHLAGFSLNYDLVRGERMSWTIRTIGQWSRAEGDFTAHREIVGNPDPQVNPFEAIAPSEDVYQSWNATVDSTLFWRPSPKQNTWLFLNASYTYGDFSFDVDVPQANNKRHQQNLLTDGYLWVFSGGVDFRLGERLSMRMSVVYAPLDVRRPNDYDVENDSLENFRLIFHYDL